MGVTVRELFIAGGNVNVSIFPFDLDGCHPFIEGRCSIKFRFYNNFPRIVNESDFSVDLNGCQTFAEDKCFFELRLDEFYVMI